MKFTTFDIRGMFYQQCNCHLMPGVTVRPPWRKDTHQWLLWTMHGSKGRTSKEIKVTMNNAICHGSLWRGNDQSWGGFPALLHGYCLILLCYFKMARAATILRVPSAYLDIKETWIVLSFFIYFFIYLIFSRSFFFYFCILLLIDNFPTSNFPTFRVWQIIYMFAQHFNTCKT